MKRRVMKKVLFSLATYWPLRCRTYTEAARMGTREFFWRRRGKWLPKRNAKTKAILALPRP